MIRHHIDDSGMTLIETVISIAMLGIILGPITGSLVLGYRNTRGTTERTADSSSAQLMSVYLEGDFAGSKTLTLTAPVGACAAPGAQWASFSSTDPGTLPATSDDVPIVVSYVQPCSSSVLQRIRTVNGVAETPKKLMTNFSSMTFRCDGAACPASPQPRSISATVTTANATTDPVYASFTFKLEATRRVTQ